MMISSSESGGGWYEDPVLDGLRCVPGRTDKGGSMTIVEAKEKYGERILSLVATEIVASGLDQVKESDTRTALDVVFQNCVDDLSSSSWDEIRSIIKRSL